jgi:glycosyltransferase involved in cell wall biosynthesis
MQVVALVTCFNKVQQIARVVSKLLECHEVDTIIIYDDCSTDGSRSVLTKLAEHERIEILLGQKNLGVSEARNILLRQFSENKIVVLVDGDDTVIPVEKDQQIQIFKSNSELVFSYSDYYRERDDRSKHIVAQPFDYQRLQKYNYIPFSSVITQLPLKFKKVHHEDYLCWLEFLSGLESERIYYHSTPTFEYTENRESVSANPVQGLIGTMKVKRLHGISRCEVYCGLFSYVLEAIKKRLF